MNDIRIIRLTNGSSDCFSCGGAATQIVGGDYGVCDNPDCMELAIEKKNEELAYIHTHRRELTDQAIYERSINK